MEEAKPKAAEKPKNEDKPVEFSRKITLEGVGPVVKQGDKIKAHYRGTLLDGSQFDASYDRGSPLPFSVGHG